MDAARGRGVGVRRSLIIGAITVTLLALLGAAFLTARPAASVQWSRLRVVAFESDDWGLQGFIPSADAWDGIDRAALAPGRFPDVYWGSTLEDSAGVARLCGLMADQIGRDGLAAVFQPNYVMSALEWSAPGSEGNWVRYDLPDLGPHYQRPGMWNAVRAGRAVGVWYPEFHASWHYDPQLRHEAALAPGEALTATGRGVLLFPGSERARELGPWRSIPELAAELDLSLRIFRNLFERDPGAVIAPDYTWQARHEDLWESRGLRVIQGKREQRNPDWGSGRAARWRKLWGRQWERLRQPDRTYLERNCRLEPVQTEHPEAAARQCAVQTGRAWAAGEPAIVETHRINFAHTDPDVPRIGLEAFRVYFEALREAGGPAPWYAVDTEIAQLERHGVSWCVRGEGIVLRNGTRTRRVVAVPVGALDRLGWNQEGRGGLLVAVDPLSSLRLDAAPSAAGS